METIPVATKSFRYIVAALFLLVMAVAGTSLVVPVATNRNNDGENPPRYDCGTPLSYISGSSRRPWRIADSPVVPTTVPGEAVHSSATPDRPMTEACQQAMAPRLGFTTWALATGLVVVSGAALLIPAAAKADARHGER